MRFLKYAVLFLLLPAVHLTAATPSDTPTFTPSVTPTETRTPTVTPTGTRTQTVTPTGTRTATGGASATVSSTFAPSSTASAIVSPTVTPTATPAGPSATPTASPSQTPSRTASTTPPPSSTPVSVTDQLIDDFEDGDDVSEHGGQWGVVADGGGSSVIMLDAPGCPDESPVRSRRCQGSCSGSGAGQFAGLELDLDVTGGANFSLVAPHERSLGFRAYSASPMTLTVEVQGDGGTAAVQVYLDGGGWQNVTVLTPDHQAAEGQLQLAGGVWAQTFAGCRRIRFLATHDQAGTLPFDFRIDDVRWRALPRHSQGRIAAAFSMSLAQVREAYSFGLTEEATWQLLVLARRCGCSPTTVLSLRSTMSWGQIAANYGTTWAATVTEAWDDADAAGLEPEEPTMEQILRVLRNGAPTTSPLPTVTPYVPLGPMALPPAGGC